MGCCIKKKKAEDIKISAIAIDEGKSQQGTKELKQNYIFNEKDKDSILSMTEFGKVVKAARRNDPDSFVAIKIFEKKKLGGQIE